MASGSKRHTEVNGGGRFGKPGPKPPPDSATTQFDSNSNSPTRNRLITVRKAERIPRIKMYKLTTPIDKLLHAVNFSVFVGSVFGISLLLQGSKNATE